MIDRSIDVSLDITAANWPTSVSDTYNYIELEQQLPQWEDLSVHLYVYIYIHTPLDGSYT